VNDEPEPAARRAFRRVFVADDAALSAIVPELQQHDVLAVDIEMGQRMRRKPGGQQEWRHILALIQLAAGDLSVVVDPLRCSVAALAGPFAGAARKVLLGGGQDVAMLARAAIPLEHVVDIGEVARSVFGPREDGMAALANRIFGITIDKTVRRTDWMVRPLNPALLSYAHQDAELTLQIYAWLAEHYPVEIAYHERRYYDTPLAEGSPEWLRDAVARGQIDVLAVVREHGIDLETTRDRLGAEVLAALADAHSPRLINRLLRAAADLKLTTVLPQALTYRASPSSLVRAAAARAVGSLAEPDEGEIILRSMAQDERTEVQHAAQAALKELRKPPPLAQEEPAEEDTPALGVEAISALERLKAQLEASS
jgi:ribonuclease D